MRCPVPYALLALLGWGLADTLASTVRPRLARALRFLRMPSGAATRTGPSR